MLYVFISIKRRDCFSFHALQERFARWLKPLMASLLLVQPETLLRWHRELFRVFWKHKSKVHARKPRLSPETISLIKEMAANNRLWGGRAHSG